MALNASIFGNMLAQPKSPEEYLAERQQLEQGKMANMLNRQKLDEYSRGVERQGQLRNLLATGADSNALRQSGFLQEADDWDKNAAEAGLKRSQALKAEADAQQIQLKAASDRLGMIYNAASGAKDQQSYSMARAGLQAAGVDVSAIPEMFDPDYVENAKTQALTEMQRLEKAMKDREFALKASNEIIGPDGKVNTTLLNAKKQVAQAGAARTNVNVNTDKTLTSTMAKGLGEQLDSSLAGANAAVNTISTANQIRDLVSTGNIVTGPGADYRIGIMRLGDMLGVGGKDTQEKLANTSALVQSLAKTELDAAAGMKGQGQITDAERAILRRAAAGELNMSPAELITLSNAMDKTARSRITSHQTRVQQLKAVPGTDSLIPFYSVEMPGQYKPKQSGGNVDLHSAAEAIIKGGK